MLLLSYEESNSSDVCHALVIFPEHSFGQYLW